VVVGGGQWVSLIIFGYHDGVNLVIGLAMGLVWLYLINKKKIIWFGVAVVLFGLYLLPVYRTNFIKPNDMAEVERDQKIKSIKSIFLARAFYNKYQPYYGKFIGNSMALVDINNYFFGFHPREGEGGYKLDLKFPFFGVIFLVIGFLKLNIEEFGYFGWWIVIILMLSGMNNFAGYDFVLIGPILWLMTRSIRA